MKILSIDTSCDETAAAIVEETKILSNMIWSQASAHAEFGGVMPSLAKRMHQERIDFVVEKALKQGKLAFKDLDGLAVTIGPGLAIALEVGIKKAKELAETYQKPLFGINHLEGHVLSPLANNFFSRQGFSLKELRLPALGLVVSGGNTLFLKINKIGEYQVLAATVDDALGEALDKGARMLGLGYPGGAILEEMAKTGDSRKYDLPIPLLGKESRLLFSYSGLKTAFWRLTESEKSKSGGLLSRQQISDLAACFQDRAFEHLIRVLRFFLNSESNTFSFDQILVGGGVIANLELRKRLRRLGREFGLKVLFPYSVRLCGDNAAMIGLAANLKTEAGFLPGSFEFESLDRQPGLKLGVKI